MLVDIFAAAAMASLAAGGPGSGNNTNHPKRGKHPIDGRTLLQHAKTHNRFAINHGKLYRIARRGKYGTAAKLHKDAKLAHKEAAKMYRFAQEDNMQINHAMTLADIAEKKSKAAQLSNIAVG